MSDLPQDPIYLFVERAYMRLQAENILSHCLDEGVVTPIHELVEDLVLSGPENLDTLRDILDETIQRKTQIQDDLHQVFTQFSVVMDSYGIKLGEHQTTLIVQSWTAQNFIEIMQTHYIEDVDTQNACLQVWQDSSEIMDNLTSKLNLLGDIELYLMDWLWGLAFQTAHRLVDTNAPDIEIPQ